MGTVAGEASRPGWERPRCPAGGSQSHEGEPLPSPSPTEGLPQGSQAIFYGFMPVSGMWTSSLDLVSPKG